MNRDEVNSGLEKCAAAECNEKCPYNGINYGCRPRLMLDARELLKEQEPKPVLQERQCEVEPNVWERKGFCPKCHQIVRWSANRLFCGFCGQEVKWDERNTVKT